MDTATGTRLMDRGSRMHVLDWVEQDGFAQSLSEMVAVTGMTVTPGAKWMPRGGREREEARLGINSGGLIPDDLNLRLRDWWLARPVGANMPNWDLACSAVALDGRPGLILMEAKAHVNEFTGEAKGKGPGNPANHARIAGAIEEARLALSKEIPDLRITVNRWYQLANRIAFAWKLAASGVPTALVYLGFVGDAGVGLPIRDARHWKQVLATASNSVPAAMWGTRIDCGAAPLWVLAETRECWRQTPLLTQAASMGVPASDPVPATASRVAASQGFGDMGERISTVRLGSHAT